MTEPCFIYARISQDRDGEGLGVERQQDICREYADAHDLTVVEVFVDNDISAYGGKVRPEYSRMLDRLRGREVKTVLVYKVDRLYRRMADLVDYIDVCTSGPSMHLGPVSTVAVQGGGKVDLSTATGRMHAEIMASFAQYESGARSERLKAKYKQMRKAGQWKGGTVPFGWRIDPMPDGSRVPVVDDDKADAIRQACRDVLAGASTGTIMRHWNGLGWTGSNGKPFSQTTVRSVLCRGINAGFYEKKDAKGKPVILEGIPSPWPAIVDESIWRGVKAMYSDPDRRRTVTNRPINPLSGIAQCHCGNLLYIASTTGRDGTPHKIYRCRASGKGHTSKRTAMLDELVMPYAAALYAVFESDTARRGEDEAVTRERETLESEVAALVARLDELVRESTTGNLSASMLARMSSEIESTLDDKRNLLAALASRVPMPDAAPVPLGEDSPAYQEFLALPIDDMRTFLRTYMNVICWPGRGTTRAGLHRLTRVVIKTDPDDRGPMGREDIDSLARAHGLPEGGPAA